MFDNERYVTRGIANTVPLSLQIMMWNMINELCQTKKKIDYLQVFKVCVSDNHIHIEHSSTNPKYDKIYEFGTVVAVHTNKWTIWVMDDGVQSVMMFPEER